MRYSGNPDDKDYVGYRELHPMLDGLFFTGGVVLECDIAAGTIIYIPTDEQGCMLYDRERNDWKRLVARGRVTVYEREPGAPWC